jgi:fatty-acid desaturase
MSTEQITTSARPRAPSTPTAAVPSRALATRPGPPDQSAAGPAGLAFYTVTALGVTVGIHRRHHAFTDRPGVDHSPYQYSTDPRGQLRGLAHAHLGWMFTGDPTVAAGTRPTCSLTGQQPGSEAPFRPCAHCRWRCRSRSAGQSAEPGTGAVTALIWADLVRVALLQHLPWSVNTAREHHGKRPPADRDDGCDSNNRTNPPSRAAEPTTR